MIAWSYIKNHPRGQVKSVTLDQELPASEGVCAIEFPDQFAGGIDCMTKCKPRQGQYITAKHLDLDFEASRQVRTVPMLEEYDEKESMP
jgi:hypothetical protein